MIGELKFFVIPGIVGVFESLTQIAEFDPLWFFLDDFSHKAIDFPILKEKGNGNRQIGFRSPTMVIDQIPCGDVRRQGVGFLFDFLGRWDLQLHLFLWWVLHCLFLLFLIQ